jgi:phosphoribosylformylglycinamidine cyclo-ligase
MSRTSDYASAGVDTERGALFLANLVSWVSKTAEFRPGTGRSVMDIGYFASVLEIGQGLGLALTTDGVGTKILVAELAGKYDTIGIDCVAMNVNDMIVQGAEPLIFLDYIGIHSVDPIRIEQIVKGVADGCREAECALLGGETAEMPDIYAEGDYDLAGFSVGVVELARAIDPVRVQPDDVVLGLAGSGLHSNGFTLVRKIIDHAKLKLDRVVPEVDEARTLGEVMLTPTRIYVRPIVKLQRRYRVKKVISGMAHITGGGLAGNLERALNDKVDAVVDRSSWEVPPIFDYLAAKGGVDDDEMRRVFNMGIGYVLIVRPTFADSIAEQLEKMGERVFRMGRIVRGKGTVKER